MAGDHYDEETINTALHRLTMRQQQRQYHAARSSLSLHGSTDNLAANTGPTGDGPATDMDTTTMNGVSKSQHNANETFDSFVAVHTSQSDLTDTTGLYTSAHDNGSKNYLSAQQQQLLRQQRMTEQSRQLLEHSKAKHQAMVAQAHAAASRTPGNHGNHNNNHTAPSNKSLAHSQLVSRTSGVNGGSSSINIMAPKPPPKPHADRKPASSHRMAR